MKILILEHVCIGACGEEIPAALADAGHAMWLALSQDFARAGHEVRTATGTRQDSKRDGVAMSRITFPVSIEAFVAKHARLSEATLIVAPETNGASLGWARKLVEWGVRSLGCAPEAVELCGDKFALSQHLDRHGINVPHTQCGDAPRLLADGVDLTGGQRWILKPRDGAGCEQTYFIRNEADVVRLRKAFAAAPAACEDAKPRHGHAWALHPWALHPWALHPNWILQPYCEGQPVSASFIVHEGRVIPLLAGAQLIELGTELRYRGGEMPLPPPLAARAMTLAERAVRSVPGLRGFVGVDLVLGESAERDVVIEINPRVTMSYCGLRRLSKTNLAAMMLDASIEPSWRDARVRFDNAGRVEEY